MIHKTLYKASLALHFMNAADESKPLPTADRMDLQRNLLLCGANMANEAVLISVC